MRLPHVHCLLAALDFCSLHWCCDLPCVAACCGPSSAQVVHRPCSLTACMCLAVWACPDGCSDWHVIEGWRLAAPYQLGVATSGKGILLAPASLGGLNLSDFGDAPGGAHFVDDIWLNGHLAAAGVPRWVVPLPAVPGDMQVGEPAGSTRGAAAAVKGAPLLCMPVPMAGSCTPPPTHLLACLPARMPAHR
jgi:hypothetical protein